MKKRNKIIILLIFILLITSIAVFLYIRHQNRAPKIWGAVELKSNGMLKCNGGNSCFVENGKVTPKKIDQKTIDILNNHCRDPRNCPPPSADQIKKSVAAIRAYEKSESLLVAPITTNPALGYFVFCTKSVEGQCWAVDDETSEVLGKIEDKK